MKVKNIIAASVIALFGLQAQAQTMSDAFRFSNNDYYGTARTMAMGNAFTALGGDLGSIGINPAGSSVNTYSQFTITPAISILATNAGYNSNPSANGGFNNNTHTLKTGFNLPNLGFVTTFKTGRRSGIKSFSLGAVINSTANYLDKFQAFGTNEETSMLGYLAAGASANGISSDQLNTTNYDAGYNWMHMVAYQSGMISTIDAARKNYIGATEKLYQNAEGQDEITLGGPLDQHYGQSAYGNKYDVLVNFGMNINDMVYVGANLGLNSFAYESDLFFREKAVDPHDFENEFENGVRINFMNAETGNYYAATGSGVYGKFGVIVRPFKGLRIGAAIQTPTMTVLTERWQYRGQTEYSDKTYNAKANSDMGSYEYRLLSPYRGNIGIAYTSRWGLVSADYEFCDYSLMRFKELGNGFSDQFDLVNRLNSRFYGFQHNFRVGAEFRLPFGMAARVGYNLLTCPERIWRDDVDIVDAGVYEYMYNDQSLTNDQFRSWEESLHGMKYSNAMTHALSFGLGWQSKRSFFFDLACRGQFRPDQYTYPYDNYLSDGVASPEIRVKSNLWDVVATFGWRF